jgi:hypothetical protein
MEDGFRSNEQSYWIRQRNIRIPMIVDGRLYADGYRKYLDPPDMIQMIPLWGVLAISSNYWRVGYRKRQEAIAWLADSAAQHRLIERLRKRNSSLRVMPDMPAAKLEQAVQVHAALSEKYGLDVLRLSDIPSYGPSVTLLWAEALEQGLQGDDILGYFWRWQNMWPPAWERDDERKAKKLPFVEPEVAGRLKVPVKWTSKPEDLDDPWEAEVNGERWIVHLNEFPDEYMYRLTVDGTVLGDFHDWPEPWDRSDFDFQVTPPFPARGLRLSQL